MVGGINSSTVLDFFWDLGDVRSGLQSEELT